MGGQGPASRSANSSGDCYMVSVDQPSPSMACSSHEALVHEQMLQPEVRYRWPLLFAQGYCDDVWV